MTDNYSIQMQGFSAKGNIKSKEPVEPIMCTQRFLKLS